MANYNVPTGDFVTSTLNGAIAAGATSATIGAGLALPATSGILQVSYDTAFSIGATNGAETITYATYNTVSGALTGITRGMASTIAVQHDNGQSVQAAPSVLYFLADIQNIIAATPWTSWVPTYSAANPMTYTSVTTTIARYQQLGKNVTFMLEASGTTGGTASGLILFTLPVTARATSGFVSGQVGDTQNLAGLTVFNTVNQMAVERFDQGNFGLGANRVIRASGTYEAA